MTYRNNFFLVVRRLKFITHEQVFQRQAEMECHSYLISRSGIR